MTFESWLAQFWPQDKWPWLTLSDIERLRVAYNAVDRAAREESAEICDSHASIEGIAQRCADRIRETMK